MQELATFDLFVFAVASLLLGMFMLIRGGNWTVDSAVFVARHLGISPVVVGFTIIAFGTSFPELVASLNAHMKGYSGMMIGNVLGSNIANVLLVVGVTAVMAPMIAHPRILLYDIMVMGVSMIVFAALMMMDILGQGAGMALVFGLLAYIVIKYHYALKGERVEGGDEAEVPEFANIKNALIFLLFGLVVISLGAEFLVRGATTSARLLGVPDVVIGMTVIALGTSLPELSTCIIAAMKKHGDVVLGNIIGSNIFNVMMIIGISILAKPLEMTSIDVIILQRDVWVALAVTALFAFWLLAFKRVSRADGLVFLLAYVVFIVVQCMSIDLSVISSAEAG